MARYTPEFLASLRQRYEGSDRPMRQLARDFGIGISTLSALVEKEGWHKRSQRRRGAPEAPYIAEASALMAALPPRGSSGADAEPLPAAEAPASLPGAAPPAGGQRSAAERLEALLTQEIAAEEAARAELGELPHLRAEADGCTRRLAILTQTLKTLRAIPPPAPAAEDDQPMDIDELREDLARRLHALIDGRIDSERAALNHQFANLTDAQIKELAEVGRERGMEALLQPLEDVKEPLD